MNKLHNINLNVFLLIQCDPQNRPVPLVPNLQSLPPVWNGQRRVVPQLHVDALADLLPTAPPANRAAALQHKQQVQRDQEQAEALSQFERQSIPKTIMHSADNIRCNAYFYAPALAQPHLLPVSTCVLFIS